ncbi:MAG TPA: segregation/condensation protein A, partial [Candidatus Synoicihabitans sp.]|nr:segregation/condensation protein A [Candidatus Synoicihabitans sp.]
PVPAFREASVFELVAALRRVLERLPQDDAHEVTLDKITVRERMTHVLDTLRARGEIAFEALFDEVRSRMETVVTFLAILELVKVRAIRVTQEELGGPIMIHAAIGSEQAAETAMFGDGEEGQHGT